MQWMILPYRRYFDFSGRSRRREYWMFALFNILVSVAIDLVFGSPTYHRTGFFVGFSTELSGTGGMLQNLFGLVSFIPGLAVAIRRLHDQDRSGWLLLLVFIPILGWFALLVLMLLDGTRGRNRFGPDPKNPGEEADVFS
ncbi:MAG: DUF805 domain-containing protein [Novosphingobium sp.]|nr:DUF805 domain-containing protein [Novosphingobium sp.]MCP5403601.1 DUF805 domain-containing protein [Novosphingobium sp.]